METDIRQAEQAIDEVLIDGKAINVRQFSEKEQTPLSPTTVSAFGPRDLESAATGISLDATAIARRGSMNPIS